MNICLYGEAVRVMKYEIDRCALAISVRELCYLATRHGDLGSRSGSMIEKARIGREVHTELQRSRGVMYKPEVSLTNTTFYGGPRMFEKAFQRRNFHPVGTGVSAGR